MIQISGVYTDPAGVSVANARIIIAAKRTTSDTFRELLISQVTGPDGEYSFELVPGYYRVTVLYPEVNRTTVIGDMELEANSPAGSLNDYVRFADPVLADPTVYAEIKHWYGITSRNTSEAVGAAAVALEAKDQAKEASHSSSESANIAKQNKEQTVISAEEAKFASLSSKSEADKAEAAAGNAQNIADANTYYVSEDDPDGTISGLSGTPNGKSFRVGQGAGNGFKTYVNNDGVAIEISESPGATEFREYAAMIANEELGNVAACYRDGVGYHIFDILQNGGFGTKSAYIGPRFWENQEIILTLNNVGASLLQDPVGYNIFDSSVAKSQTPPETGLTTRDLNNKLMAQQLRREISHEIESLSYDFNVFIGDGQSFSPATEAWPALTTEPFEPGNLLMLGDSVRGSSREGEYKVLGDAVLNDMVAVTQTTNAQLAAKMAPEDVALLNPGASNEGEISDISAIHFMRKLNLQLMSLKSDPSRKIIVINVGVAGRTLEQLSKGNPSQHYELRYLRALDALKAVIPAGKTVGLVGISYDGNQYNYDPEFYKTQGTRDKTEFKNLLLKLFDDMKADFDIKFGTSPDTKPAIFLTQTGGPYTRDITGLSIGMAQIEAAEENEAIFLVGPSYHVTDKGGNHPDANGQRWNGQIKGRVMHKVFGRRENHFPLKFIRATISGTEILCDALVESPPLIFRESYYDCTPKVFTDKGVIVKDNVGNVPVNEVSIAADTILRISLTRETVGSVTVWFAPFETSTGATNICDSESATALYKYEYTAGSGQYPRANIEALVNKPYPLNNFCCAQVITVERI
ncbi:prophage tail fiber N-terminal domain-containing protein [Serratia liquefaciens]